MRSSRDYADPILLRQVTATITVMTSSRSKTRGKDVRIAMAAVTMPAAVISRWVPEVLPHLPRLRVVPSVAVWDFSDGISFQALEQVIQQIAETRASGS